MENVKFGSDILLVKNVIRVVVLHTALHNSVGVIIYTYTIHSNTGLGLGLGLGLGRLGEHRGVHPNPQGIAGVRP